MAIIYGTEENDTYIINDTSTQIQEGPNAGTDTVQSRVSYTLDANVENLELIGSETQTINGLTVYGNPIEWGNYLDYFQGDNSQRNANSCLFVSIENFLIQAGVIEPKTNYNPLPSKKDLLESTILRMKTLANNNDINTSSLTSLFSTITSELNTLYETKTFSSDSIMNREAVSLTTLANYVKDGRCIIATCDANVLWGRSSSFSSLNHAVTITGVAYDGDTIEGFYICDSGRQRKSDSARFVSYDLLNSAFCSSGNTGTIFVSGSSFKQSIENINGTGNSLDNQITGNSGQNTLIGFAGNDTLNGAGGADTLYGGTGSDTYYINSKDTVIENTDEGSDTVYVLTDQTYHLVDNVENLHLDAATGVKLYGNSLANTITGNTGNDTIYGGDGSDLLIGSAGHDKLYGGNGDDIYYIDSYDNLIENKNQGDDSIMTFSNFTLGDYIENIYMLGTGHIKATGNSVANDISGNSGNNTIIGNGGNDNLEGYTGNDTLYGGSGNDTYTFNSGDGQDVISDSSGTDNITFGSNITRDILNFTKQGKNLVISIENTTDKITIQNFLDTSAYQIETLNFSDNSQMSKSEIIVDISGDSSINRLTGSIITDELNGYSGNDTIYAGNSNDTLYGGAGNDYLNGENDNDFIYGNEDNDDIFGNNGNDTLDGGTGNDTLHGDYGNDTYIFNLGDGQDIIADNSGNNNITFGSGITRNMLNFSRQGKNLVISIEDTTNVITIKNFLDNSAYQIGTFNFSDNSQMSKSEIILDISGDSSINRLTGSIITDVLNGYEGNDILNGGNGNDTLYGNAGNDYLDGQNDNDVIYGNENNDNIFGNNGNDTLDGGVGNDTLNGGSGNDTYIFNLGDGQDTITDGSGTDNITFGSSITRDMLNFSSQNKNLVISIENTTDKITIQNFLDTSAYQIETFNFSDNSQMSKLEIIVDINGNSSANKLSGTIISDNISSLAGNDIIYGNNGNDTITGGSGNDILYGGNNNDTYVFNLGDGQDIIADNNGLNHIRFGENITSDMLSFSKSGNNLCISVENTAITDKITILNYINSPSFQIEKLIFSDNSEINRTAIALTTDGTASADTLSGSKIADIMNGLAGNDTITSSYGNDTINGGAGSDTIDGQFDNDVIYGNADNDLLKGATGNDILNGGTGTDTLYGGYGDDSYTFSLNDGKDHISDYSLTRNNDKITFDSTVSTDDIAFFMQTSSLVIDYGTTVNQDRVSIQNQRMTNYAVEKIELSDGKYLTNTEINNIIQNIIGYDSQNAEVTFTSVNDVKANQYCMNLISSSWHS